MTSVFCVQANAWLELDTWERELTMSSTGEAGDLCLLNGSQQVASSILTETMVGNSAKGLRSSVLICAIL